MKRRQKRVLQMAFVFMVALIFLPNVGLWSLYREKHLMKSHEGGGQGFSLGLSEGHIYTWMDGLKRRDWHDNESIRRDELRVGKGEHGKPYPLGEDECDDSVYKENGFNIYVSNNIALDRSLPDIRHPNCRSRLYLENLPNTSIIIPFHNEGWSSLLRTIHSITRRTPDHLIAEIVLVDDYSDRALITSTHHRIPHGHLKVLPCGSVPSFTVSAVPTRRTCSVSHGQVTNNSDILVRVNTYCPALASVLYPAARRAACVHPWTS
uniref:Glycosyltransferase 2-like domain-containing protein n=1 Tax=Esox lucius TaxID=8010 RepID=A0AAY5K6A5_ESOLU